MNPPYKNTAYPIKYVGNTPLNIVKNANSLAPTFPGVGIGDIAIYKST